LRTFNVKSAKSNHCCRLFQNVYIYYTIFIIFMFTFLCQTFETTYMWARTVWLRHYIDEHRIVACLHPAEDCSRMASVNTMLQMALTNVGAVGLATASLSLSQITCNARSGQALGSTIYTGNITNYLKNSALFASTIGKAHDLTLCVAAMPEVSLLPEANRVTQFSSL
jgi:hypothetical protein